MRITSGGYSRASASASSVEPSMPESRKPLRRGEIIGKRVGGEPAEEAEHVIKCPTCGGYVDMRDLAQVLEHEGPLPHPVQDRPK